MEEKESLKLMNYWNKQVNGKFPRSAKAILRPNVIVKNKVADSSCGSGECNCGGGCNGECSTSCEG